MKQPTCTALKKAWLTSDHKTLVDGEDPSACVLFARAGQVRLVSDLAEIGNASEYFYGIEVEKSTAPASLAEPEPEPEKPRRGRPPNA